MDRSTPRQSSPGPRAVLRSTVVTMGPSLFLVAWCVAGVVAAVAHLFPGVRHAGGPALSGVALGGCGTLTAWLALRPWYRAWGATAAESRAPMPGDGLVASALSQVTRAVDVAAPPTELWAWLVQLGQGRGGLFSYDWLENLAGLDIHTLGYIDPALQVLRVGDEVALGPGAHNGFVVADVTPARALVLRRCDPVTGGPVDASAARFMDVTWVFELVPLGPGRTRLRVRLRVGGRPRATLRAVYAALVELPHFVMERRMLLELRRRAEALAAPGPTAGAASSPGWPARTAGGGAS